MKRPLFLKALPGALTKEWRGLGHKCPELVWWLSLGQEAEGRAGDRHMDMAEPPQPSVLATSCCWALPPPTPRAHSNL